ncbi:MAG TPA: flagellar basal body-associated FliL family protein [Peptostreptococcaceae bacterium]|nr:flagellar basal body-associated FliL family protein [Peptostreptococcaceae bacterium]
MGKEQNVENKIKKILTMILFLVVIVGASFVLWTKFMGGPSSAELKSEKKVETINLELDEILVKLSDSDKSRYIKTNIVLSHDEKIEDISNHVPQIRDAIISYFMSKKAEDFSANNMVNVKKDMIKILKNKIDNEGVYDIYFVNLIVQ